LVYFWNANTGIAVGDPNGNTITNDSIQIVHGDTVPQFEIWQTNNGGASWLRVSDTLVPPPHTNEYGQANVYAVYGQKVWFGTSIGRVYSSSDSGRWVTFPTGLDGGVTGLAFRDSLNGIAWGFVNTTTQQTTVMNTTNGGQTWSNIPTNIALGVWDFCNIRGTYGYMSVGLNEANSLYATSVTYSDGAGWATLESNMTNIEKIYVVQMTDTLHGWAGSYTTNGATNGMNKYIGSNLASIKQIAANNNQVTVYPNPSNGYFNLSLTHSAANTEISVCDMPGNEVYKTTLKENTLNIDLSAMQKGMYLLKLQSGNTSNIQKLIIQ
jgi:photosystem II stability/assembly factor-like uncharacterized protein